MRLSVIGTGYLGAVHAACMAHLGHDVIGVDIDAERIASLAAGAVPFYEPGLQEVLSGALDSGRLRFSTSLRDAAEGADVHFICVGTPQQADSGAADLSYVHAAIDGLAPYLGDDALLVGKSTVPVGTTRSLVERLRTRTPHTVEVAWNPEFLREGFGVQDTLEPDRIVVGVTSSRAEQRLREVYDEALGRGTPWIAMTPETAELVKVSANSFLATKISFINAMAEICEGVGADVVQLGEALGLDDRIGGRYLQAGLGFGGGCLPKDIRAYTARANELGLGQSLDFLRAVDDVNTRCRLRTVRLATDLLGGSLRGRRVAVLGSAFKPGCDDVRDSPALDVARRLVEAHAVVRVHDPEASDNARRALPGARHSDDPIEVLSGAELVLHLTDWAHYRELSPERVRDVVARPVLIDARNALDLERWRSAGWDAHALGRSPIGSDVLLTESA